MNATEYFKKHGHKHCKSTCMQNGWLNTGFWVQLKRLVESYELVENHNGVDMAKRFIDANIECNDSDRLKQAIADVESCMEGL